MKNWRRAALRIPLAPAALFLFAAPLLAVNLALAVSIYAEAVPACFPYLDGRISVSRAGRSDAAAWFFKPLVICSGIVGFFYWQAAARRLASLPGGMPSCRRAMAWIGAGGAALLILYAIALGNPGDFYRFMRRVGIYAYFFGITFAQILFAVMLQSHAWRTAAASIRWPLRMMWASLAAMLALAFIVLPLVYFLTGSKSLAERSVEWNYLLPMHLFFLASFFAWKKIGRGG